MTGEIDVYVTTINNPIFGIWLGSLYQVLHPVEFMINISYGGYHHYVLIKIINYIILHYITPSSIPCNSSTLKFHIWIWMINDNKNSNLTTVLSCFVLNCTLLCCTVLYCTGNFEILLYCVEYVHSSSCSLIGGSYSNQSLILLSRLTRVQVRKARCVYRPLKKKYSFNIENEKESNGRKLVSSRTEGNGRKGIGAEEMW